MSDVNIKVYKNTPHPADFGIRIRRCEGCECDTRAEAITCLVVCSSDKEVPGIPR